MRKESVYKIKKVLQIYQIYNMPELTWKEAIIKVLEDEKRALRTSDIAELIAQKNYRKNLGATPKDTVSSQLTTDLNNKQEKSVFARVEKGLYILRKYYEENANQTDEETSTGNSQSTESQKTRIVNAFGIYWNRNLVHWKSTPDLFGIQQLGASQVNFKDQIGVYLLHDGRETIYVGQAIEQPLGQRLRNHTSDRLSGRWDRFSWFGFYPVKEDGQLNKELSYVNITVQDLGNILEAILIESIEPRQNRKQGNLFSGIEFLQQEAPEIKKKLKAELLKDIADRL